jgi:hypothetical protein
MENILFLCLESVNLRVGNSSEMPALSSFQPNFAPPYNRFCSILIQINTKPINPTQDDYLNPNRITSLQNNRQR